MKTRYSLCIAKFRVSRGRFSVRSGTGFRLDGDFGGLMNASAFDFAQAAKLDVAGGGAGEGDVL